MTLELGVHEDAAQVRWPLNGRRRGRIYVSRSEQLAPGQRSLMVSTSQPTMCGESGSPMRVLRRTR